MEKKANVIVFDLDYTLWPFWVDTHLLEEGYELGVASRTSEIKGAKQLLDLFGWKKYFKYVEIFPGSKVTHFLNIQKSSQADYKDMIFFDDETRNIMDVGKLGVHAILVRDGVTRQVIKSALQSFGK
ncbi:magnesium-dependent phosphatase 1-like protein [Lasius niger]|uniref:Magnesium-dependent phosphatase 1-like protein n=1 Tax=Lasius niger TaxID=67767 RepID=A0A0J7L2B6_LASNI|nr:magnesium-dependent phosphatase 1-like protein [Lasius niger]